MVQVVRKGRTWLQFVTAFEPIDPFELNRAKHQTPLLSLWWNMVSSSCDLVEIKHGHDNAADEINTYTEYQYVG